MATTLTGSRREPRDYPGMQRALDRLDTIFVPDARDRVRRSARPDRPGGSLAPPCPHRRGRSRGDAARPPLESASRAHAPDARAGPGLRRPRRARDRARHPEPCADDRRAARAHARERLAGDLAQLHAIATSLGAAYEVREVAGLVAERVLALSGAETAAVLDVTVGGSASARVGRVRRGAGASRRRRRRGASHSAGGGSGLQHVGGRDGPHPSGVLPLLVEGRPSASSSSRIRAEERPDRHAAPRRDDRRPCRTRPSNGRGCTSSSTPRGSAPSCRPCGRVGSRR